MADFALAASVDFAPGAAVDFGLPAADSVPAEDCLRAAPAVSCSRSPADAESFVHLQAGGLRRSADWADFDYAPPVVQAVARQEEPDFWDAPAAHSFAASVAQRRVDGEPQERE